MSDRLGASTAHEAGVIRRGWRRASRQSAAWCQICGQISIWEPRSFEPLLHVVAGMHSVDPTFPPSLRSNHEHR